MVVADIFITSAGDPLVSNPSINSPPSVLEISRIALPTVSSSAATTGSFGCISAGIPNPSIAAAAFTGKGKALSSTPVGGGTVVGTRQGGTYASLQFDPGDNDDWMGEV